jgi:hypothetical protein
MFYVTFHGGGKSCFPPSPAIQTIYAYNDDGSGGTPYASNVVGSGTNGLRDIQLGLDGKFYVVNSYQSASEIWQITPDGSDPDGALFTAATTVPSIYHPFAIAFDASMHVCAIANQDTNVVVFVYGPSHPKSGQALPINPVLAQMGPDFLPGTFVASQNPLVPPNYAGSSPPAVADSQGGLSTFPSSGKPSNSVRGIAFVGTTLYVADEPANCIRMYDAILGDYLGKILDSNAWIQNPVHLLPFGAKLYISVSPSKAATTGSDVPAILCYDTSNSTAPTLTAVVSNIANPSGMTFDKDGNFYLACRTKGNVNKYDASFQPSPHNPFITDLPDCPEFILYSDM